MSLMVFFGAAFASTVAVLDLEKATGGESYDGLGRALAGMLVSDLSQAPGLSLVERSQLDAVLAELDLSATAFIDPATAQTLGSGLAAEFLVVGSYSVLGDRFLLDARVLGAESGKVVRAARADGTVDGFVEVEKALVTELLDGLAVKLAQETVARIDASVPTRSFDAFTAYGAAVTLQDQGKIDEAREAFAAALRVDPKYEAAHSALGGLELDLDRRRLERMHAEQQARAELLDRVVARFAVPANAKDRAALTGFALRLAALRNQGRYCQRYDEMMAFLDRVDWTLPPPKYEFHRFTEEVMRLAVEVGYAPAASADAGRHADVKFDMQTGEVPLFVDVPRYFYAFPQMGLGVERSADLLTSMAGCKTGPEVVQELALLTEQVRAHGLLQAVSATSEVPLGERLEWTSIVFTARSSGVDAAMAARIRALIDAHPDGDVNHLLRSEANAIVGIGTGVERARVQRFGFREQELAGVIEAVAKLDPARVALDDPECGPVLQLLTWQAKGQVGKSYYGLGTGYAALRDLGCLVGTPARFDTAADAFAWLTAANHRKRPDHAEDEACKQAFVALPDQVYPPTMGGPPVPQDSVRAQAVLAWYYLHLEADLCVTASQP